MPKTGYLFRVQHGQPIRKTNFRRMYWLPAIKAAGLTHFRFHDLRHTAITLWIAAGLHARQIQAFAGHASIVTTLDRYGHILPGAETALAVNLEAMIAKASGTAEVIPFPLPAE